MAKKAKKMIIDMNQIKVRKSWGKVQPFSRDHGDKKKETAKKVCRRPVNRGDFALCLS